MELIVRFKHSYNLWDKEVHDSISINVKTKDTKEIKGAICNGMNTILRNLHIVKIDEVEEL